MVLADQNVGKALLFTKIQHFMVLNTLQTEQYELNIIKAFTSLYL